MPFYTYKCSTCQVVEEIQHSMDSNPPKCENCKKHSVGVHFPKMKRVWKSVGKPQFKGSGFYETDYKTKDKPK